MQSCLIILLFFTSCLSSIGALQEIGSVVNHSAVYQNTGDTRQSLSRHLRDVVEHGTADQVRHLLSCGASKNEGASRCEKTVLHCVAESGDVDKLKLLLDPETGAIEVSPVTGPSAWTPLHYAARHGHENVVWLLLIKGAKSRQNFTSPANVARASGRLRLADLIFYWDVFWQEFTDVSDDFVHRAEKHRREKIVRDAYESCDFSYIRFLFDKFLCRRGVMNDEYPDRYPD